MKLQNAARMGDTQVAVDAYAPTSASFLVGFDPLSYSKIDAAFTIKAARHDCTID